MRPEVVTTAGVTTALVGGTLAGVFDVASIVGVAAADTGDPPTAFTTGRFLAHWWVFPAAVLFSTIALASAVPRSTRDYDVTVA